tara:strand:- start:149 stop:886 length:738 start_codon:yes stop_codon:yes gene_type:complete
MNLVIEYKDGSVTYLSPSTRVNHAWWQGGWSSNKQQVHFGQVFIGEGLVCCKHGHTASAEVRDDQYFNYTLTGELAGVYYMFHTGDDKWHNGPGDSATFAFNWNHNITYGERQRLDDTQWNAASNLFAKTTDNGGNTQNDIFGFAWLQFDFENNTYKWRRTMPYRTRVTSQTSGQAGNYGSYPWWGRYNSQYPYSSWPWGDSYGFLGLGEMHHVNGNNAWSGNANPPSEALIWTAADGASSTAFN